MYNQELYATAFARAVALMHDRPPDIEAQKGALRALVALAELSAASFRVYDGVLSVDDVAIPHSIPHANQLVQRLQLHRVSEFMIGRRAEAAELLALLRGLAALPGEGDSIKERLGSAHSRRIMVILEESGEEPYRRSASVSQALQALDVGRNDTASAMAQWEALHSGAGREIPITIEMGPEAAAADVTGGNGAAPAEPAPDGAAATAAATSPVPKLPIAAETPIGSALAAVVLDPYGPSLLNRLTALSERVREAQPEDALRALAVVVDLEPGAAEGSVRNSYGIMLKRTLTRDILTQMATCVLNPALMDAAARVVLRSGADGVDVLLELLAGADGMRERRAYMSALRQTREGTQAVLHMLGHPEWFVARNVAELAGDLRIEDAVPELARLTGHADARVRKAAIVALARIGTPPTVRPLREAWKRGDSEQRVAIAASIGSASRALAMPLVALLEEDATPEVAREVYLALGRIGSTEAVRALAKAAEPGGRLLGRKAGALRVAAVQALRLAGATGALERLAEDADRTVQDEARRALQDLTKTRGAV
jgi:HEAT repeat protein